MKKLLISMFYMFMIWSLCACMDTNKQSSITDVKIGTYILEKTEENVMAPYVILMDNKRFSFYYSALSSNIPSGEYQIKDNNLILLEGAENEKVDSYVFKIEDEKLIFQKKQSTALPDFAANELNDGAVFGYVEDLTKDN